ncbi:unnamed protein product [Staurois parvus]|uniref:Uncharacterized protein n=1 Tax=Staurois parvus TaxID=386267 RepID=A0ABN9CU79_9NEOB|nr:unnamed protein product [Staurois parvus]
MVGSQARDQNRRSSRGPDQAGSATNQTGTGTGMQDTGAHRKTHTKAETAGLAIP